MRRVGHLVSLTVAALACLLPPLHVGAAGLSHVELIARLLDQPAPIPDWRKHVGRNAGDDGAPEDPDAVLGYWLDGKRFTKERPEEAEENELLEAVERRPETLPGLLEVLSTRPVVLERVKALYDTESPRRSDSWGKKVRDWLMQRSDFLRNDLMAEARGATDSENGVAGQAALEALARLDPEAARPILEDGRRSARPRLATLALSLLYKDALRRGESEEEKRWRTDLKAVATDREAPGYARNRAVHTLMASPWPGQNEWYLSLFSDPSILHPEDGFYRYSPLGAPVIAEPDYWIPRLVPLVGHPERAIHDAAVDLLAYFHLERARPDALRPLLPWLKDPQWSSADDRLRLIQSVYDVGLVEAVPGLIRVVEQEPDYRGWAAQELGFFKAGQAAPALRQALVEETNGYDSDLIVGAAVSCDAYSAEEMARATEAFAIQIATPEGREEYWRTVGGLSAELPSAEIRIGAQVARRFREEKPPAALVDILVERLERLTAEGAEHAESLADLVIGWPSPQLDRYLIASLRSGELLLGGVLAILERRTALRVHAADWLPELVERGGLVSGIAAVVAGDSELQAAIFESDDTEAHKALLATARLVRQPLGLEHVAHCLLDSDPQLLLAARRYLEADDSPDARRLLWQSQPGEALILGLRPSADPGHHTFRAFDAWENDLRAEVLSEAGPVEIMGLLATSYWGGNASYAVRVRPDGAELTYREPDGDGKRPLTEAELQRLRSFISDGSVDDLPPLAADIADGVQYEYLHLTRNGGRRLFMNNPGWGGSGGSVYQQLILHFRDLVGSTEK